MINDAAPTLAKHTFAMSIIHHQQNIVLFGDFVNCGQWGNVAIHAEDPVRHHQSAPELAQVGLDLFIQ